ncbi:MAG: hypothetical protein JEZ05_08185 [Tenericutes bacterium]|nr:hypothetical protein [Mycoplasmatota bacterium]
MIYFFLILPLLLFIVTSYMLNSRKLIDGKLYIVVLSLLEAILSFLIIVLFFIQGYLPGFLYWSMSFFALLVGSLIFFYGHRDDDDQWDLQLETIKNNILIFLKTLLPMYFFIIMFRFWNPFLQILTAIILTILLALIAKALREYFSLPVSKFFRNLGMSSIVNTLWIWVVFVFIVAFNFVFQLPNESIKSFFNLNDSVAYLSYDEMPTDLQNNYNQKTLFSIKLENELEGSIADYYYDDEFLYLYTTRSEFLVFNNDGSELIYSESIDGSILFDSTRRLSYEEYYDYFVYVDGHILLFDTYGIYQVNSTGLIKLLDISNFYSKHFLVNEALHLLVRTSETDYEIYQYDNGTFESLETIDTTTKSYNELVIISDYLFDFDEENYFLHSNNAIIFPYKINNTTVYDGDNSIMYYSQFIDTSVDVLTAGRTETVYTKITEFGEVFERAVKGQHSVDIVAYNNRLFVTGFKTMEVLAEDFEYDTIYNHVEIKSFLKANKYKSITYTQFNVIDESTIEFLQEQRNSDKILIQINRLVEEANPLQLPFYTHYGFLTIVPILIGCIFELTDFRTTTHVISYQNQINKKKED